MESLNILFTKPQQVEVCTEPVASPREGQVLCKATKSLLSTGTEMLCLRGEFDVGTNWADWVRYPFHPGYSMVGEVVALGENVAGLKEGDRVFAQHSHNQYFAARPEQLVPIPESVSDEEATWLALAVTTQLGARRSELRLGETVGVIGQGLLGQLVVQYLRLMGARTVVAIDTATKRLDMARAGGATHTLAMTADAAIPAIQEITDGRMLDVVYDVTGHPAVLASAIQLARRLGRVVLLGDTPTPSQQCLGPGVVSNSIAILGIHATMSPAQASDFNPWTFREMALLFCDFLAQGRMQVKPLITHHWAPEKAPDAYAMLASNRENAMGVIFDW